MQTRGTWVLFAVVCTVFGTTFLAIRMGILAGASALLSAGLRFALAGLVLTGWRVLGPRRRGGRPVDRRQRLAELGRLVPRCSLAALFMTVLAFGCMYLAERRADSGFMARLEALGPLLTALAAGLLLGQRLKSRQAAGLGLGLVGMLLLARQPAGGMDLVTLLTALGGVVFYALGTVLYARLFGPADDPVAVNGLQMLLGGLVLLGLSPLLERPAFPLNPGTVGSLLYLVLAGSIVAHTANLVVIRRAGPVFAAAWLYVSPPLATLAGWLVLGETAGWEALAGTVLALAGVCLMNRRTGGVAGGTPAGEGGASRQPAAGAREGAPSPACTVPERPLNSCCDVPVEALRSGKLQ